VPADVRFARKEKGASHKLPEFPTRPLGLLSVAPYENWVLCLSFLNDRGICTDAESPDLEPNPSPLLRDTFLMPILNHAEATPQWSQASPNAIFMPLVQDIIR
jgi:hypothetical protein